MDLPVIARRLRTRVTPRPVWAMPAATVGVLLIGFALQLLVYGNGGHSSLSDLPHLVLGRGIGPDALPYLDRPLEYPVGSGLLFYLATLVTTSPLGVLIVTAVAATATCVVITVALERRVGARAWRWAVGTPVLLFAFQNWDVFAIAAMVFGILAFDRGNSSRAGVWLGVGAFVKLFPAFVIPPLVISRWARGDRRGAVRLAGAGAVTFAVLNLPVLVANPSGWWYPLDFQSQRQTTWGTVWHYGFRIVGAPVSGTAGSHFANAVCLVALVIGLGWLSIVAVRRRLEPFPIAAVAVAVFVLTNKVYSPTYDVWLVPFFVLLAVPRRVWVGFCAVDLAIYVLVFGYFHGLTSRDEVHMLLPVFVFVRAALLVALVVIAVRPGSRPESSGSTPVLDGDPAAERRDRGGVETDRPPVDAEGRTQEGDGQLVDRRKRLLR
ncbi:MAG: glycosyltransferase 87 family protein [Acidimicrobiia bacterium]